MVTICQTCGDEGYSELLIECDSCDKYAVHRYCFEVITFDEFVVWYCDDCKPLDIKEDDIAEPRPSTESNDCHALKSERCSSSEERDTHNSKTAKLTRPSGGCKKKTKGKKNMVSMTRTEKKGSHDGLESSCSTAKTDAQTANSQQHQGSCSVNHVNSQTGDELADEKLSEEAESNNNLPPLPALDSSDRPMDIDYVPAQPILDPVWRGGIQITKQKESYSCRIMAHSSQLACSRAREEAKLFPETLSSELHPRTAVWPRGFEQCGPRDDNIALYFFPEGESDEKVFRNLISEMIRCDYAIKAVVAHAELLVFTSTKLPLRHWRFRGKLYLWGVFRKKQDSSEPSSSWVTSAENISKRVGSNLDSAISVS